MNTPSPTDADALSPVRNLMRGTATNYVLLAVNIGLIVNNARTAGAIASALT